jgi:hypothetical protein
VISSCFSIRTLDLGQPSTVGEPLLGGPDKVGFLKLAKFLKIRFTVPSLIASMIWSFLTRPR